jgi:DNA-binding transcriptional MerR regulator
MAERLTITEVAAATGLAPSALRYYERKGLIAPAGRRSGTRVYEPDVLEDLALVDLCQQLGFTIAEIAVLVDEHGPPRRWRDLAERKLEEVEAQLAFAQRAKTMLEHLLGCGHRSIETCPVFHDIVREHAGAIRERAAAGAATS